MIFSYLRVSTGMQTVENQRLEITKWAKKRDMVIEEWVEETISSGKTLQSRKIFSLIDQMRSGDVLIISELSRIARRVYEVMEVLQKAMLKNVKIFSIKEGVEFGDNITSKVLAFAFGLSAEIERNLISERTKCGLARAVSDGKTLGRPKGAATPPEQRKLHPKKAEIVRLLAQDVSVSAIGRIVGAHRLTVDAYIKENSLAEKAAKRKETTP